jgi:hypothetical protein
MLQGGGNSAHVPILIPVYKVVGVLDKCKCGDNVSPRGRIAECNREVAQPAIVAGAADGGPGGTSGSRFTGEYGADGKPIYTSAVVAGPSGNTGDIDPEMLAWLGSNVYNQGGYGRGGGGQTYNPEFLPNTGGSSGSQYNPDFLPNRNPYGVFGGTILSPGIFG